MKAAVASLVLVSLYWTVEAQGQDIDFRTVILASPSSVDRLTTLPVSATTVSVGSTYYLEVWVSDVGAVNTGVSSAYVDVAWPAAMASAQGSINHGSIFYLFSSGAILAGGLDELGGSAVDLAGVEPEWARVAVVPMTANAVGTVTYALASSTTGVAARNRGKIPWIEIHLHGVEVTQCQGGPQIVQQPAGQSVCANSAATLSVTANSSFSLEYRWRKDGIPLNDDGPFSGTTTATLTVSPVVTGTYDVVVSDACDAAISNAVTLSILNCDDGNPLTVDTCANNACVHRSADFNGNGRVDKTDLALFRSAFGSSTGDPTYNPNADLNGDGVIGCNDWNLFIARWPANTPRPAYIPCKDIQAPGRSETPGTLCGAVGPAFAVALTFLLLFSGAAKRRRRPGLGGRS